MLIYRSCAGLCLENLSPLTMAFLSYVYQFCYIIFGLLKYLLSLNPLGCPAVGDTDIL